MPDCIHGGGSGSGWASARSATVRTRRSANSRPSARASCRSGIRGLIEAHRMAVTVRQLKPVYQESVMKMALRMGRDVRTILDGLTQVEGRKRSAFHEYLDKVARDLR